MPGHSAVSGSTTLTNAKDVSTPTRSASWMEPAHVHSWAAIPDMYASIENASWTNPSVLPTLNARPDLSAVKESV